MIEQLSKRPHVVVAGQEHALRILGGVARDSTQYAFAASESMPTACSVATVAMKAMFGEESLLAPWQCFDLEIWRDISNCLTSPLGTRRYAADETDAALVKWKCVLDRKFGWSGSPNLF